MEVVEARLEAVRTRETQEVQVHLLASPARPVSNWEPPVASPGELRLGSSWPPDHWLSPTLAVLEPSDLA